MLWAVFVCVLSECIMATCLRMSNSTSLESPLGEMGQITVMVGLVQVLMLAIYYLYREGSLKPGEWVFGLVILILWPGIWSVITPGLGHVAQLFACIAQVCWMVSVAWKEWRKKSKSS